ncbi:NAD(P)-binding domain-containing protein [Phycisphaera mikurensis]|uniref:4Fe-4S ferredoxin-type domain-containing protein n=1 Tax=Phycisphaera mikurensis (strain NBRC 102666 / KCTC 22515 / FYK2301M01) TaxID=1142394 RepID=I0IHC4_PHYMF|nr:NAD(P)-binding domain-containing protein [Phycisphaera mikurensis]MBB6440911.1 thioredoxin reductase/ferredoxin [Phycisphaera mikurensis]BAM04662.1 hypothetical protein PSMK_25030 [Phycisphaera mikurensis NBRC 102666]
MNPIARYTHWLHTKWPAGKPEVLPVVDADGGTNVPGLYVVGDLSGVPLLKLSVNAGVGVIRKIKEELPGGGEDGVLDVAIVGGGTSGFAAAREAEALGLSYCVFEASEPFSTIVNFPRGKPIYKYPTGLELEGGLAFHDKSDVKEGLLEDLREQTVDRGLHWAVGKVDHVEKKGGRFELVLPERARPPEGQHLNGLSWITQTQRVKAKKVVVAIGRSGNYRKLGVPGEEIDGRVFNRLFDPRDTTGKRVLIVGGGDSAMEAAIACTKAGADVTLSYRKPEFNRPKPENREMLLALARNPEASARVESPSDVRMAGVHVEDQREEGKPCEGCLQLEMGSNIEEIREGEVDLKKADGQTRTLKNDTVYAMIGREAPLAFFRKSGVDILGEKNAKWWVTLVASLLFFTWMYHWTKGEPLFNIEALKLPAWLLPEPKWFWDAVQGLQNAVGAYFSDLSNLGGTIALSASGRGFYYTLAYCVVVVIFGVRRVRRRKTPYVKLQTITLAVIQIVPLFLLPEILLPWAGHNGWFESGWLGSLADTFFPRADYGHGREYWRAYGFILAWPLMAWNWFTAEPLFGWLILGALQTFVAIPAMIYFWGKGSYCGWICSCGALAETLGDTQRHKMPHGPFWNRMNMIGQAILLFAIILLALRVVGWVLPEGNFAGNAFRWLSSSAPVISWAWGVDLLWAGILGVAMYFHFSGRVWCRFACPLAALMHVYARFSKFRILADKKKCISCNVCTSVCHQGIDVMSFANKGEPMADPQCVRCSACVQMCPTGVLSFGTIDRATGEPAGVDPAWLASSPVNIAEGEVTVNGRKIR